MPTPNLDSFRKLPEKSGEDDFWIVSVIRMPGWIDNPPTPPFRPYAALVVTAELGIHIGKVTGTRAEATALLLPTIIEFATKPGVRCRPARIATDKADTEEHLRTAFEGLVELKTVADLPPLEAVKQEMLKINPDSQPIPSPLLVPGVTVQDLRAFAQSAADFYRAAPWHHLNDHDLIRINAPHLPDEQKYVVVMGSGGETFGLAFYRTRERYNITMNGAGDKTDFLRAPEPVFSVTFNKSFAISFAEHDLWEDQALPLAAPDRYPFAGLYDLSDEKVRRPGPALLDHAQATLAALAATTEEEIDTGRWTKTVLTLDGPAKYTLAIPSLLKPEKKSRPNPMENPMATRLALENKMGEIMKLITASGLTDPKEINRMISQHVEKGEKSPYQTDYVSDMAADLLQQAHEARGRRQIQLAREVLKIDADNADAMSLLAQRAGDTGRRIEILEQAVEAGRRAIGKQWDSLVGHFWGFHETRPYMRARCALALALRAVGREQETLDHLMEMLKLNPNDNQGNRDLVPASLLALGRNQEVLDFTQKYGRDNAIPAYASALASFRLHGNSPESRNYLEHAIASNAYVPQYLTGKATPPPQDPLGWSPGQPSEALFCLLELAPQWEATPGALKWIASTTPPPKPRKTRKR